ncbi:DUF2142 domain-containing protein [Embleya sp. NPDC055664]
MSGPVRHWLLAFVGFLLLGSAWALAAPYDGTPDEMQHIIRAAGVAQGEFAPTPTDADTGTGAFQNVPRSLVRKNCWAFKEEQPASCAREPGGDKSLERTATRAGRYNPVYYAAVGWPLRVSPDWTGILLARLISTTMVAALLATAAYSVVHWTRHRLLLAGVLAATTPMTLHLSGAINPNALEIAAGTALFCALVPLLLEPGAKLRRSALVVAGISGVILCTLRSVGPLWLVVALAALVIPTRRTLLNSLRRSKPALWAGGAIVLAAVAGAAWTVGMKASQLGSVGDHTHITFRQAVRFEIVGRSGDYLKEMVGVTSWLDMSAPQPAYTVWYMVLGVLVVAGVAFGSWTDRWRMFVLVAVVFGFPTLTDAMGVNKYGFVAQGRYMLPIAVGVPILAAFALSRREVFGARRDATLIRTFAIVLMPLQLVFLWFTMIRWQHGWTSTPRGMTLNAFAGPWHPQVGSVVPVVFALLGCAAMIAYCWTVTRDRNLPREVAAG